ncbi:MAG: thiaminase II [Thermomicrobiales bacterium]|nr:thiaminase II [Thermomicrobiales bacterium]
MSFSVHLRSIADDIWEAQHRHPVVTGIGDGSLDPEIFGFWLRQDYLYLIDYARLFGAAVLKAPSLELMTTMAQLAHEILHTEMALHRSYVAEFGITEADLLHETKAPTCQGYTDFLLRTATIGDFAELMGALLPCMWGYGEIGARLAANGCPDEKRYARWIAMYASEEFQQLATWCRDATDAVCEGLPPAILARVEEAFITSSRYELAFWQMAWTRETWSG